MPTLFRRTIHGEYTERTDNIATNRALLSLLPVRLYGVLGTALMSDRNCPYNCPI
jgi:hypothetical protein